MKRILTSLICIFAFSSGVLANAKSDILIKQADFTDAIEAVALVSINQNELTQSNENSLNSAINNASQSFDELAVSLISANYETKKNIIHSIAVLDDSRVLPFIESFLKGQLFYIKKTDKLIYRQLLENKKYLAISIFDNSELGEFKKRKLKKVGINNNLRGEIKRIIATLQISSIDTAIRKLAALEILTDANESTLALIESAINEESDEEIREILVTAQAIIHLKSDDSLTRINAIKALDSSLYVESRNALSLFINEKKVNENQNTTSNITEKEITQAKETIVGIDKLATLNNVAQNIYFGVSLGSVLLLAAIGLAITFGVMGVINMAHGEMIMLGAYTTFVIQQLMPNHAGISLIVAIPAAFLVSGLMGVIIERTVIRHLYGRPLETLLATFGISLVLQQAVRSIFGPLNQDVITPSWMAGTFTVNAGLELTFNRLYIIIFSLMVLAALALVLKKTLFGLQMRAVTMNRPMASSMGIRTGWVDALTFGLGSGIAGIAGVALSQLTNVGPNLGQAYIIDSFMVVVFGGVGNLWGTLVGAMSLGIANKVFEPMAGAVLAKIIVLVAIILFIQKRPRGLFALKGRAVED
ncbi:MAG: urea ABC transporter permease subunit UrtB [Bermanella sp.]